MTKKALLVAALLPLSSTAALAANYFWTGGGADGSFDDSANWGGGPPTAGDAAHYDTKPTSGQQTLLVDGDWNLQWFRVNATPDDPESFGVLQTSGTVTVTRGFQLGTAEGGAESSYKLAGGTLRVTGRQNKNGFIIGNGANEVATFTQEAGTVVEVLGDTFFGGGWNGGQMNYIMNGGTLTVNTSQYIDLGGTDGKAGTATFEQNGGEVSINMTAKQNLTLGAAAGSSGTYKLSAGTLTIGTNIVMVLGASGASGTFEQSGGSVEFTEATGEDRRVDIGSGSGSVGKYTLSDGTLNMKGSARKMVLGTSGGSGTFEQTGGTFNFEGGWLALGQSNNANSVGYFTQTGGSFTTAAATNVEVGQAASATSVWTVSGEGTEATFNGEVNIGRQNGTAGQGVFTVADGAEVTFNSTLKLGGSKSTFNLNGGTVTAKSVAINSGAESAFIFNGGTLKAGASASGDFVTAAATAGKVQVAAGGGTIDTNGQALYFAAPLTGDGDLTKVGTGTLTLQVGDSQTFTGTLQVNAGEVNFFESPILTSSMLGGDISVAAGAVLSGKIGTLGELTVDGTVKLSKAVGGNVNVNALGGVTLNSTAVLEVILASSGGEPISNALLSDGAISIASGAALNVSLDAGYTFQAGDTFYLLLGDSISVASGDFADGTLHSIGGNEFRIEHGTLGTLDAISLVAVPEPSTYALMAGGLALGLAMLRRRKQA